MAKSVSRKNSAAASSSKTSKVSATSTKAKPAKTKAKGSKKRVNYKQEYIKLLEKNNKLLTKEVKAIRKAIEQPKELPSDFEAFPKETPTSVQTRTPAYRTKPGTIEDEILGKLTDIEVEIRSRDAIFEDLVHGSPKLTGGLDG